MRVERSDPLLLQDFLAARENLSRRAAKDLIDRRRVWVNRACVWMARYRLKVGDTVELSAEIKKSPEKHHVRILWQDDDYLVCDKPAGLVTCGAEKSVETVLRVQEKLPSLEAVHRLDRDTTGCLLFAKRHAAFLEAVEIFRQHKVSKTYHAISAGRLAQPRLRIDAPLDGDSAVSLVTREACGEDASLLRVRIETGRTNQIRRHLASVRAPIVGDRVFGLKRARDPRLLRVSRQMLHASTLEMSDPRAPHAKIRVHAPFPADFRAALRLFGMGK